MNVLVYGLGAIGITFATLLKKRGHIVYGKVKDKNFPISLFVDGIWGKHSAKLDGVSNNILDFKDINTDLIILAVKSYDTEQALNDIKKILRPNSIVLLTQNGYGNYEMAVKIIGKKHTLLGRIIFGAKVIDKGKVRITVNADDVRIGQPDNAIDKEVILDVVDEIDKAGIPASYSPDVYKILWDKILYNCALNPLGAILECSYGELADNKNSRIIMNKIIEEIFLVAKLNSIQLNWDNAEEYIDFFYNKLVPPTRNHFPSMYYDIKAGKRTEIDALNGAIVKLAEKAGIKAPTNETVVNLIKFKEISHKT